MISNLRRWLVRGFYKLSSVANEGAVVRAGSCWWGKVHWTVRKVLQWWCITTTTVYQCTTTSGEPAMHHFVINDSAKEKEIAILSEVATILSTLQGTDISTISKWNSLRFVFFLLMSISSTQRWGVDGPASPLEQQWQSISINNGARNSECFVILQQPIVIQQLVVLQQLNV